MLFEEWRGRLSSTKLEEWVSESLPGLADHVQDFLFTLGLRGSTGEF